MSKRIEEIPIDERYLHRFATMKFTKKLAKDNKKDKKLKEEDDFDDVASINSDEFDLIMGMWIEKCLQNRFLSSKIWENWIFGLKR